jgi:ADP-ribosylglycohydrolase
MFEIGVGDAYGACFEGVKDNKWVNRNNDLTYSNHPRKLRKRPEDYQPSLVPPGGYTDDTQMAIAIAEAMLDDNEPWTKFSLADRFLETFHRDQRRGYTTYFLNVLLNSQTGEELLTKIDGRSTKSGGVMRAGPIGLYPEFEDVVRKARLQASVTHDSWLGRNSAVGAALMVHYFYYDLGPKEELCGWLRDQYFGDSLHSPEPFEVDGEVVECWSPILQKRVRVHAWDCLEAAIYAIEAHDSMSKILQQCVAYTGDVDTVAAIAMGPASLCREITQDLPDDLVSNLENKRYGRDFLKRLDLKLFERFPRKELNDEPLLDIDDSLPDPVALELSDELQEPDLGDFGDDGLGAAYPYILDEGMGGVEDEATLNDEHTGEGPDSDPLQHEMGTGRIEEKVESAGERDGESGTQSSDLRDLRDDHGTDSNG